MTLDSENAIEKNNHFKKPQLVVDTEEPYHIYNYKIAIHSQIHDFGWDKTRYFLPKKKDNFDFDLLK